MSHTWLPAQNNKRGMTISMTVSKKIEQTYMNKPVLVIDFNCHITVRWLQKNSAGFRKLVKQCDRHMANLDPTCNGTYTWSRNSSKTTIDYVLYNEETTRQHMHMSSIHTQMNRNITNAEVTTIELQ